MESKCIIRVCDCYHENSSTCWDCSRNENPKKGDLTDNYVSLCDKVNELFKFLTDEEIPDGVVMKSRPKLSSNKAWSLIWFLQEVTRCLPDHIERCDACGDLYDSESEGVCLDDQYSLMGSGRPLPKRYYGFYCGGCIPPVNFTVA